MEHNNVTFPKALEILIEYVGGNVQKLPKLAALTSIYKKFAVKENVKEFVAPLILNSNAMDKYTDNPIKEWLDEGISQTVLEKYQVRYDLSNNRVVFPIWDNNGNIISISGRTLDPDFKKKKIRKYTYYGSIGTTHFFFGYWQNQDEILSKNEILIFEGAKSVFKAEDYGCCNAVASMTDDLTDFQIELLVKMPVKDVVICWDKEVTLKRIKNKLGVLLHFKNCYALIDKWGLLNDKDAPVDKGEETFLKLYENKVRVI